jgi:hypothetical protein
MPNVDVVAQAADGTVLLVLRHDPITESLDDLQRRVHDTVGFALDGQLTAMFPSVEGRPIAIRVDTPEEPGPILLQYFELVRPRLIRHGIDLRTAVVP